MSYTVVGLFNNRNQAETAIRELTQRGFVPENIDISNRAVGNTRNTAMEEVVITDSVANFFNSLFNNDKKNAGKYAGAAADADSIVTVHVGDDERAREAAFVLDKNGAIDIDGTAAAQNRQNPVETDRGASAPRNVVQNNAQNNANYQAGTSIPVIEEQLQIDKQVVETGGVRVRSRVVEKPVEENFRLRNQYVIVNRHRVDREVTDEDFSSFREGEIEFLELAEVPVIGKHARVVEEVEIGSQVSEHDETVRETLRSTDVEVEEINRNMPDDDFTTQKVNRSSNG